jgi:hypothetical protein
MGGQPANFARANDYLAALGCDSGSGSVFLDVPIDRRQYARALWLTFASMWAKEEGIEV